MDELPERLQSILDEMQIAAGAFSLRCGFSRSHIGLMLRSKKTGKPVTQNPTRETLAAIAREGNVELEWLATGKGPRRREPVETGREERYHAMPAVRAMARADGYPEEFVSKFEVELDLDEQPSADSLWSLLKIAWESHQRAQARAAKALPPKTPDRGADPLDDLQDGRTFRGRRPA